MTKSQIAAELEEMELGRKGQISRILDGLAVIAQDELAAGEDFSVPGICRISWTYRAPKAKGERWKKGEEVVGFGGIKATKEEDSPVVKALVKIRATPAPKIKAVVPKSTDATAQRKFISTKVGKNIVGRKGK